MILVIQFLYEVKPVSAVYAKHLLAVLLYAGAAQAFKRCHSFG